MSRKDINYIVLCFNVSYWSVNETFNHTAYINAKRRLWFQVPQRIVNVTYLKAEVVN